MLQAKLIQIRRFFPEWIKRLFRVVKLFFHNDTASPTIRQAQLDNCIVFENRLNLLASLTDQETIGAEVGVLYGDFSENLLSKTKIKSLTLIDINTSLIKNKVREDKRVKIIQGLSENYSAETLFDWIYLDGDHSYQGVKRDIEHFEKFLKPGGFLIFNDYCKFNTRSLGTFGVHRAANEFITQKKWKVYGLAFQPNCLYDLAIQKPKLT